MPKKILLAGISCCLFIVSASAQDSPSEEKDFVYELGVEPMGLDFYKFSAYYYNGKKVYNLQGEPLSSTPKYVKSLKVSPSGDFFAVLKSKGKKSQVLTYNMWLNDSPYRKYGNKKCTAVNYSPDGEVLLVATSNKMYFYRLKNHGTGNTMKFREKAPLTHNVENIEVSPDSRFVATYNDSKVVIWNMKDKSFLAECNPNSKVNDVVFSDDGKKLAVLTDNGTIELYYTDDFSTVTGGNTIYNMQNFTGLGEAVDCSFHPDGNHVSVVTADNRITILNLENQYDHDYIETEEGGIKRAQFVKDGNNKVYLCYNTNGSIVYEYMDVIAPQSNTKLLSNELNDRLEDWKQRMPGESLEEYNLRMSEDNLMKQTMMFEQEIATRMAENLVQDSEVSFGSYSQEKQMLALNFDNMPSIYLDVPSEDVNDFMNPGLLEFKNEKYILADDNTFQMTYAEVYNTATGKSYVFDNQERMSLDFLKSDEDFIPLNFVQQSSMEEMKLQEIKEEIVSTAKQNDIISDHTNISVDSKIVPSHDADGNRINNYEINFSYEVESGFSVREDFAPGKYKVDDSGAAKSMLSIIKTALEKDFAQYIKDGKKLQVVITGMADALKINRKIAYDGTYGDFVEEPVYKNDVLNNITVTKASGITENEQLAFLRAVGVKEYISKNINDLDNMDVDYRYNINLTSGTGGEFRRITVEFTFVDAFIQ